MEGILKVTPEELQATATDFGAKGNTIRNLTQQMTGIVSKLSSGWMGEASQTYLNKFKGLESDIEKINTMIQNHVKHLNEMATEYRRAESANKDQSQGLGDNVIQ